MPGLEPVGQGEIVLIAPLHGALIELHGFGVPGDLRRGNKGEGPLLDLHIALGLDAVGGQPVAGDLGQERAGDPLDGKGEVGVLDGALVPDLGEHLQKALGLFFGEAL